jgi:hypothetical protein
LSREQHDSIWRLPWRRDETEQPQSDQDVSIKPDDREPNVLAPDQLEPSTDFPISINALVGNELHLAFAWRNPMRAGQWELASSDGQRVASLRTYESGDLARIACADGAWGLNKRRRYGWELVVESSDGRYVGSYSGHHWLPGGTIALANGTRIDLRRSLRGWKLRVSETRERIVDPSEYRRDSLRLTIRSRPTGLSYDLPMVVLTTCAVLMLTATTPNPPVASGGG